MHSHASDARNSCDACTSSSAHNSNQFSAHVFTRFHQFSSIFIGFIRVICVISVASQRAGREGGRLVPPSLPAPDTPFPHKEHKIGFPVITCSPSQHGGSQGVDISSPELPREVPRFFRRGGFKGRFSKLPALPYISSRQLKCVATPRTRGGRASIKERAVLRK